MRKYAVYLFILFFFVPFLGAQNGHEEFKVGMEALHRENFQSGVDWLEQAAEKGSGLAMHTLGIIFSEGIDEEGVEGVEPNIETAIQYFEMGIEHNVPESAYELGFIYDFGVGVEPDMAKAKSYYEMAAKYNMSQALMNLGLIYLVGDEEGKIEKNDSLAIHYFTEAANRGNVLAMYSLGEIYGSKKSSNFNREQSIHWYEKAATQQYPDAMYDLAYIYEFGYEVDINLEKAKSWYQKADEAGHKIAGYRLEKVEEKIKRKNNLQK